MLVALTGSQRPAKHERHGVPAMSSFHSPRRAARRGRCARPSDPSSLRSPKRGNTELDGRADTSAPRSLRSSGQKSLRSTSGTAYPPRARRTRRKQEPVKLKQDRTFQSRARCAHRAAKAWTLEPRRVPTPPSPRAETRNDTRLERDWNALRSRAALAGGRNLRNSSGLSGARFARQGMAGNERRGA